MAGIYADKVVMVHEGVLMQKADIPEEDKELITKFVNYKTAEAGISQNRANKFTRILRLIATRYLNGSRYADLSHDDVVRILAEIERSEMKAWTKHDYKLVLRMFLDWLGKDVSWIKVRSPPNELQAEDMLSEADVTAMINAATNARDKAIVSTLFESGLRISELGEMQIKDVTFDQYGAVLVVRAKKVKGAKSGTRRVRIVGSAPYLAQWLDNHPLHTNREAPLWVSVTNNEMMNYFALRAQLQKIAKRAGITKKVNPHNFRHSRATYLASHLTESQLEEYLGWVHGSASPRTYVHLSGRDVDDKILELAGLKKEAEDIEPTVRACPFCHTLNTLDAKVCRICKRPVEIRAEDVISLEDQLKSLQEQYEAQQREIEAMKEREKERAPLDDQMTELMERLLSNQKVRELIKEELGKMDKA